MKQISRSTRSRRLRKKLHVGEFQQLGFEITLFLSKELSSTQSNDFWDSFIGEIEANNLTFGGGEIGFVVPDGRTSATEGHRQVVQAWLSKRPEISSVTVGPLVDAWHLPQDRR
jgi:uncharacterized protein YggL (DUF469 family)